MSIHPSHYEHLGNDLPKPLRFNLIQLLRSRTENIITGTDISLTSEVRLSYLPDEVGLLINVGC